MAEETNIGTAAQKPADNKNMKTCKSCGASIAKNAKTCPGCGAKNKKPIYKRVWFWACIVVLALCIGIGSGSGDETEPAATVKQSDTAAGKTDNKKETTQKQAEYTQVGFEKLIDDLDANAYNAKQTWNGQYVEITGGVVETIDASGAYFSIASKSDKYFLKSIRVDIPADIRTEVMSSLASDVSVTVKGKISDVGEILGYSVDAQSVTVG